MPWILEGLGEAGAPTNETQACTPQQSTADKKMQMNYVLGGIALFAVVFGVGDYLIHWAGRRK